MDKKEILNALKDIQKYIIKERFHQVSKKAEGDYHRGGFFVPCDYIERKTNTLINIINCDK